MMTVYEMYEALINGTVTRDQFEDWVIEQRQDAVSESEYWESVSWSDL